MRLLHNNPIADNGSLNGNNLIYLVDAIIRNGFVINRLMASQLLTLQ